MVGIKGKCKFPFTYKGNSYHSCTRTGYNDVPWCITTKGNGNWTECKLHCINNKGKLK